MNEQNRLRLLVVDDDDVDRMAVLRALHASGIEAEVTQATNYAAAEQAVLEQPFDCVIADFHLPDGGGLQILEKARDAGLTTPFVFLAGQGDEALATDVAKRGAADFLPKQQLHELRHAMRVLAADKLTAQAKGALAKQAERLQKLATATVRIHGTFSIHEMLEVATLEARTLIGAHVAITRLITADGELEPATSASLSDKYTEWRERRQAPLPWGFEQLALRSTSPLRLSQTELEAMPEWAEPTEERPSEWLPLRGVLAVPLLHRGGRRLGLIQVSDKYEGDFDASDEAILIQLAQSAAVALENARLLHEANQATRARDEMLAIVSHDLRNPLNVLAIGSSVLRTSLTGEAGQNPQIKLNLDRLERAVFRMSRLIEDLLDASRIEAGRIAVSLLPERGASLVTDAIESVAGLADAKKCSLVPGGMDETVVVMADRHRVLQVFGNLLGNSIKFTPSGGSVTVSVQRAANFGLFTVTDTGPGVEEKHLPLLFGRFWKAIEASRDGAGLGLFIARGIVEAHGGSISASSVEGEGTSIWFTLPLVSHYQ